VSLIQELEPLAFQVFSMKLRVVAMCLVPKVLCRGIDQDGDGHISADELGQSSVFRGADTNGDGTLKQSEVIRLMDRFGLKHSDINSFASDSIAAVESNNIPGIQQEDIFVHWQQLTSLSTVDDVVDWISYAVHLPQYAYNFRTNGIKGYDLPLFLEDPQLYIDLGITKKLHQQQIGRAISMRFLGLASIPGDPLFSCPYARSTKGVEVNLTWKTAETASILADTVRVFWRMQGNDRWKFLNAYEASHSNVLETLAPEETHFLERGVIEFRLAAWNTIGRSNYVFTDCTIEAAFKVKEQNEDLSHLFSAIDHDADGDIDSSELTNHIKGLFAGDETNFLSKQQSDYLVTKGVSQGMKVVDKDLDRLILRNELEKHWARIVPLMTIEKTTDWLCHSVELCRYKDSFVTFGITGADFSSLSADKDGILERIGVTDHSDRLKLIRSITLLLLGVGSPPQRLDGALAYSGPVCDSVVIDWTAASSAVGQVVPHKYLVHRYEQGNWVLVYSGMATTFREVGLKGKHHSYRIQAWNIIGGSPPFEILDVKPNRHDCTNVFLYVLGRILSLPLSLLYLVIDNYYRVTGLISFLGFVSLVSKWSARDRRRVGIWMRDKIVPTLLKMFGSSFGLQYLLQYLHIAIETETQHGSPFSPASPHKDLVSRAVAALGKTGIKSRPAPAKQMLESTATAPKLQGVVRNYILRKRVVNMFSEGLRRNPDLDSAASSYSSAASVGSSGSPRVKSKNFASRLKKSFSKPAEGDISSSMRSVIRCSECRNSVKSSTRHICGKCHQVYCKEHTSFIAHTRFFGCGVDSKCRCLHCAQ